ncbi:hypothetical protein KQX54_015334 [Cotesia glomerata]|uniref:Uncharacterized protein n=1 Tax=Cotesia glomerata TaxID=32391 RepID=A0AAV7IS30_COTGL|nr:hypothetical protein KQX54_015334 [Cotesia glomerata]
MSYEEVYVIARTSLGIFLHFYNHSNYPLTLTDTHNGRDSPPEPAPPEVPPRGPSLLATHTIRAVQNRNGCAGNTNFASDDAQSEAYSELNVKSSPERIQEDIPYE